MFDAIFCSDCPFTAYMRVNKAQRKSFVRTISNVRFAAINYNVKNALDLDDPRYIDFKHIEIFDNRTDLNEVAYMSFRQNNGECWPVTITEYDE